MKKKTTQFTKSATADLARRLDIELDYINAAGKRIVIAPDVIRTVLATMGYRVENDYDAQEILRRLDTDASFCRLLPVLVVRQDLQPALIPVNLESHQNHTWRLLGEDGEIAEEGTIRQSAASVPDNGDKASLEANQVALTVRMPCGYHRFELDEERMSLIVVPEKCWLGPLEQGQKLWGVAAQLYLLKSERNWGIGDFTDLRTLIDIAALWKASLVGVNPLHALFADDPEQASPYAPASRLYLNILNIDVTAIPEFATCEEARELLNSEDFTAALNVVRADNMVNYRGAAELKLRMLRLIHSHFIRASSLERRRALEAFVREGSENLNRFCIFQAIRFERARRNCIANWQQWPAELREPNSPEVRAF
ncbi:MAG: 4-alpha-glucanotransferase, partial [Deltaproteobacteria bacterium]|nr:4-alpha-glucanotransferase [Deltaproteobacteria bacterium]